MAKVRDQRVGENRGPPLGLSQAPGKKWIIEVSQLYLLTTMSYKMRPVMVKVLRSWQCCYLQLDLHCLSVYLSERYAKKVFFN
jgi:hypothetical protein